MRWTVWIVLLGISSLAQGQATGQKRIDSLTLLLASHSRDSSGIDICNKLAEEYLRKDIDKARRYLHEAAGIAKMLSTAHGLSNTYSQLALYYQDISQPDSARYYLFQLEKLYQAHRTDPAIGSNYNLTSGLYYKRQGNYKVAISYLLAGLDFMKEGEVPYAGQLLNIGNAYFLLGELKGAADFHLRALRAFESLNNKRGQSFCYQSLGEDMFELNQYDASRNYLMKSLKIKVELKDTRGRMTAWRGLGIVNRAIDRFDSALYYLTNSLSEARELKLKLEELQTLNEIALLFVDRNEPVKAKRYFEQSLKIARASGDSLMMARINVGLLALTGGAGKREEEMILLNNIFRAKTAGDNRSLPEAYLGIAKWYGNHGKYEKGYKQLLRYVQLNDSLKGKEVLVQLKDLEAQYISEKKENEIRELTAKNEIDALEIRQQATQRNYLIGLVILSLILILVLYNRYTIKQKASQKLQEIDQLKSKFFANISHEFRTPLSLILGPLQRSIDDGTVLTEWDVSLMHRNAQRLHTLIDQMLDLAKIESRSMQLNVGPGPLAHFIKTICSAFASLAEQRKITFTNQLEGDLESGYYDSDKLEKILFNLISNAFKFTNDEGVVSVKATQSGDKLTVRVMDSGIGISHEHAERIFDRFYQVDDTHTRTQEGTGIGLALSRELAEIHLGSLTVESEPGRGSIFTLEIPITSKAYGHLMPAAVTSTPSPRVAAVPRSGEIVQGEGELEMPLVLVVEDNDDMRSFVVDTLRAEYRIETAIDGQDGWEKAQALVPDIIVSDIMMPRLDGKSLCQNCKTTMATSHIPVILLTARADRESKVEGLEIGADDYLTKPFDARELRTRIQNLITQREKLRKLFSQRIILTPKEVVLNDPEVRFINDLMAVLEEKYSDPGFGVDELTVAIGLSRMQLHRKIKALTGKPAGEFLRNFRIERAKQLLMTKGIQVSEVAYQCGFTSVSHFTKVFREFTAMTPTEYRYRD